jgi:hypothetical protein
MWRQADEVGFVRHVLSYRGDRGGDLTMIGGCG